MTVLVPMYQGVCSPLVQILYYFDGIPVRRKLIKNVLEAVYKFSFFLAQKKK